jgi:hypothetical protein
MAIILGEENPGNLLKSNFFIISLDCSFKIKFYVIFDTHEKKILGHRTILSLQNLQLQSLKKILK